MLSIIYLYREQDEQLSHIRYVNPDVPLMLLVSDPPVEAYIRMQAPGTSEYLFLPADDHVVVRIMCVILTADCRDKSPA